MAGYPGTTGDNNLADELAGHASKNHNDSMAKYAQEAVKRNDEYRKLVHWIHKQMLRVTNRAAIARTN